MAVTFPGVCAVVPAAGFGRRMQTDCPKQYLSLGNKTILEHSVDALLANARVQRVIIAVSAGDERFALLCDYDRNEGEEPDYEVFEEIPFWGNGLGYTSGKRNRLYLWENGEARPLTDEYEQVGSFAGEPGATGEACSGMRPARLQQR